MFHVDGAAVDLTQSINKCQLFRSGKYVLIAICGKKRYFVLSICNAIFRCLSNDNCQTLNE